MRQYASMVPLVLALALPGAALADPADETADEAPAVSKDEAPTEPADGADEGEEPAPTVSEQGDAPPADETSTEEAAVPEPPAAAEAPAPVAPMPTSVPASTPTVAAGTAPASKVSRGPNKPLLAVTGGLAAATVVTYGLAASSYSSAFAADDRPYEDFEAIRARTNLLTGITGGLAIATVGAGVSAFAVGGSF